MKATLAERLPPHSVDAEQGVLSSMLQPQDGAIAMAQARSQIDADYFFVSRHRTIFNTLCAMQDEGSCIDLITVTQWLRDSGQLDEVGGVAFVSELSTFVPTSANVQYYLDIVRDKYILRETRCAAEIVIQRTSNRHGELSAVLDELESRIASLRSLHGRNGAEHISMRSPDEILAMPRNSAANFLGDRLLGIALSLVVAGIGGIGKSRLLEQLLVDLILERIFCGIETHQTKGKPWMLIQTQNGISRLQDDLEQLKKYAGRG